MKKDIFNFFVSIVSLIAIYYLFKSKLYEFFACIICLIIILYMIYYIIIKKRKIRYLNDKFNSPSLLNLNNTSKKEGYRQKKIMSACEYDFFLKFRELEHDYIIIPQLNLAAIIEKTGSKYCNELFRNIDFAIFDKSYNLLLLIELNDKSHSNIKRRDRDLKVKKILNDCNIPLLTFYTYYPNEKQYVLDRIIKMLNNNILFKNKNS